MSLAATWSDESETEESANLVTALTGRWGSDEDSSDDEVTFEELATTYRKLCHRNAEVCQQVESQKKVITQLENEKVEHLETISKLKTEAVFLNAKLDESQQVESQKKVITQLENEKVEHLETISKLKTEAVVLNAKLDESQQVESQKKVIAQLENEKAEHVETISKLKTEAVFLNSKLEEMTKYVRMLNNGSDSLDKILQTGQITGDKFGIGFNESKPECSYTGGKPKSKPKCSHIDSKPAMSHHMSQHHKGR
jgi:chromosome segregation ATPase